MSVGIISSRTRRPYQRPPAPPYCMNRDSWQSAGLFFWCPLGEANSRGYLDYARGRAMTQNGTMTVGAGPNGGYATGNTGSTSNWLELSLAVVTAVPLSISAWFNPVNVTAGMNLVCISLGAGSYFVLAAAGDLAGDPVRAIAASGGGTENAAVSTTGYAANVWNHGLGVFTSATLRAAYVNGGSKGTDTNSRTPSTPNRTTIGAFNDGSSRFSPINGAIADVRIYGVALSDPQAQEMFDPRTRWDLYYPLGLKAYSFPAAAPGGGTNRRRRLLFAAR